MLDKVVIFLLSPLGTALLGLVFALLLAWFGSKRMARRLALVAGLWLLLWSLPVVSHSLRARLESSYPALATAQVPNAQAIVVLGGGIRPAERLDQMPDLNGAADRMWLAARLFKAGKAPLLLASGGSDPAVSATSEARAMQEVLLELGVPEKAIVLEEGSRNTRENAANCARILREKGIRKVLLVTSALHMPRAKALFGKQGLDVVAVAADFEARQRFSAVDWLPSADALDGSSRAIKELVARAVGR